jgi:MoaA/NifB/PqqE/SkfB family radical SAM enzyme
MCWHSNQEQHSRFELDEVTYIGIRDKVFPTIDILDLAGGGEVLMYSRIETVFEDIKKYHFKTLITSNFSDISDRHREILKDMNVEFVISLDAANKDLQEFLRPNCFFDCIIDNIKYFKSCGKRVTIQTTVSNYNFYNMEAIMNLADELGVDAVKFQEFQFLKNLEKPYKLDKPPKDTEYLDRIFLVKHNADVSAFLGFYHRPLLQIPGTFHAIYKLWRKIAPSKYCHNTVGILKIQENGTVLSCCLPYSKIMGDLHCYSLEEIIGSEEFEDNRINCICPIRKMVQGKRDVHTSEVLK